MPIHTDIISTAIEIGQIRNNYDMNNQNQDQTFLNFDQLYNPKLITPAVEQQDTKQVGQQQQSSPYEGQNNIAISDQFSLPDKQMKNIQQSLIPNDERKSFVPKISNNDLSDAQDDSDARLTSEIGQLDAYGSRREGNVNKTHSVHTSEEKLQKTSTIPSSSLQPYLSSYNTFNYFQFPESNDDSTPLDQQWLDINNENQAKQILPNIIEQLSGSQ
ncbi:MAG: hypothetical protein EZS28_004577 [Streblomastix strix]|uniref:Uncharacterized protein n=1 Tax=Streblomastix strix TaxID=222440 RepID=A0A5J4WZD6_9EUKA|nr:MAG: hypothetical protein EZS28_004577 [Streblomastix strix]